jgi:hypothetical protein
MESTGSPPFKRDSSFSSRKPRVRRPYMPLHQYNKLLEHRRLRLYSVESGIPPFIWYTVVVGTVINMFLVGMFDIGFAAHLVLGGSSHSSPPLFCLIAIMDNPYRGEISVSPDAFQLIYDGLMKKPAG